MRRRNYQKNWAWLTEANIENFYRVIDQHRRRRGQLEARCNLYADVLIQPARMAVRPLQSIRPLPSTAEVSHA